MTIGPYKETLICVIDAPGRTATNAADIFCEDFFYEPRERSEIGPDSTFTLVGGLRPYRVLLTGNVYRIVRLDPRPDEDHTDQNYNYEASSDSDFDAE